MAEKEQDLSQKDLLKVIVVDEDSNSFSESLGISDKRVDEIIEKMQGIMEKLSKEENLTKTSVYQGMNPYINHVNEWLLTSSILEQNIMAQQAMG